MVWKFVSHQTRVITIQYRTPGRGDDGDVMNPYISNNFPPAVLQVCRQSWRVGLEYYSLESLNQRHNKTYVNLEVDIIYLSASAPLYNDNCSWFEEKPEQWGDHFLSVGWFHKIRYLALPINRVGIPPRDEGWDGLSCDCDAFVEVLRQLMNLALPPRTTLY